MANFIDNKNLQDKDFTNAEILAMLNKLSTKVDGSAASRIYDLIEDLTGNRFFESSEVDQAVNDLALKAAKMKMLNS